MTPLPILRGSSQALYPFTLTYICQTGVSDGQNATPSRWVKGPPLVRLDLPYDQFRQDVKNTTLKPFFVSAKGQFTLNLEVALGGTTFTNLGFDIDDFEAIESQSAYYNLKWPLTQVLSQNFSPGSSGGAYPTLSTGAICQLPYTQKLHFQTVASKMQSGPKYTYAEFGGGLSGFPTSALMGWEFSESGLIDTEVATKVAHFLANWGNCFPFSFTDEDGNTYSNVYYSSPELVVNYQSVNRSSIKTVLVQMN